MPSYQDWDALSRGIQGLAGGIGNYLARNQARNAYEEWRKRSGGASATAPTAPPTPAVPQTGITDINLGPESNLEQNTNRNPMARGEQGYLTGTPRAHYTTIAPRAAGGWSPESQEKADSARAAFNPSIQDIIALEESLAENPFAHTYTTPLMQLYTANREQERTGYERAAAMQKALNQAAQDRREGAMNVYKMLAGSKDLEFNPEALPYMDELYTGMEQGVYNPEVQGKPVFIPRPDDPEYKYMWGATGHTGTRPLLAGDKQGNVKTIFEQSGIRVPGGDSADYTSRWTSYEKDADWKRLPRTRTRLGPYLTELSNARERLASAATPSNAPSYGRSQQDERTGITVLAPSPYTNQTVKRSFTSVDQLDKEIKRARSDYDTATQRLRAQYGWSPEADAAARFMSEQMQTHDDDTRAMQNEYGPGVE